MTWSPWSILKPCLTPMVIVSDNDFPAVGLCGEPGGEGTLDALRAHPSPAAGERKNLSGPMAAREQMNILGQKKRASPGDIPVFIGLATQYEGDDCIIWPFAQSRPNSPYPSFGFGGKGYRAHRVVCEIVHGSPPKDKPEAAHTCGNSLCICPAHLRWASREENEADKKAHGTNPVGSRNGKSRLSARQVRDIKRRLKSETSRSIAESFGVSRGAIDSIRSGQTWAWL